MSCAVTRNRGAEPCTLLDQVAGVEFAADLAHVLIAPLECERRRARNDIDVVGVGEPVQQRIRQAEGKMVALRVAGQIDERQDSDIPVGQLRCRRRAGTLRIRSTGHKLRRDQRDWNSDQQCDRGEHCRAHPSP